jgi:cytochrome P450
MTLSYPPGPKGDFLLGSIRSFAKDPPRFLASVAREYGDIAFMRLGPLKGYVLSNPDHVREVLVIQARKFRKSSLDKNILRKFLGRGLLISDGDYHRRQRSLVQPAFHTGRIKAYAQVMVDYSRRMLDGWADGQVLDVDEEMMKLTMFIVAKTLFDADVSGEVERAGQAIQAVQEAANLEYRRSLAMPMWLPTANNRKFRRASSDLTAIIKRIVALRRATAVDGQVQDTGDLLSMLLLAENEDGERMDDTQVRDEAVTLFAAGHETTSNALTWTWYMLSQHPEVEDRLQAELDEVLRNRPPTAADLESLVYTGMILKETMRLYPPAWVLNGRTAMEALSLGGYTIPAGGLIFVAPYVLHRQPDYFPDPERFDPERFRPERVKELPRYGYIPFGAGPRVCIGNSFAMMEARLILATVAQHYRLILEPGQEVELQPQITLSPKNGLRMRLEQRGED